MKLFSLFILLALLACGCRFFKGDPYRNTPVSGAARIAVDETLRPVVEAEIGVFNAVYGYAEIRVDYLPGNEALRLLLEDSVQLAVVSRRLSPEEISLVNRRKLYPKELRVASDAIALITHPSCRDSILSMKQLRGILTGEITNWNQLDPASPSQPIKILFDHEKSGIVSFLADSVCRGSFSTANAAAMACSREVIEYSAAHPGVIGFIGSSWISNRNDSLHASFHKRIRVMALSRSDAPTPENSYQPFQAYLLENRYPLTRSVYMINTEPRSGLCTGLVSFVASDKGQRIILKSGILPAAGPARQVNVRPDI